MLFVNKRFFLALLALFLANPDQILSSSKTVTTTTTTSSGGSNKASISIPTPFTKTQLYIIAGASGTLLVLYGAYKIYKRIGGPKSFEEFAKGAANKAKVAVKKQEDANEEIQGKKYQKMSDEEIEKITEEAYTNYFADNAGKLFKVESETFENWFKSLGGTLQARVTNCETIINQLTVDPSSDIPESNPGEAVFKSAMRYAVKNGVTSKEQAQVREAEFPKTKSVDLTGQPETSFSSRAGAAAGDAARSGVEAVKELGKGAANVAREVAAGAADLPNQAREFVEAASASYAGPSVGGAGGGVAAPNSAAQALRSSAYTQQKTMNSGLPNDPKQIQALGDQIRTGLANARAAQNTETIATLEGKARAYNEDFTGENPPVEGIEPIV